MTRAAQSESLEQRTQRILQRLFCQSKAYVVRFASPSAVEFMFNRSAVFFICALLIFLMPLVENFAAQSNWKEEWDKMRRIAEAEGQLTLYGCCYEYDRIVEEFKKKHPKINVTTVLGAGGQLGARVLAERRGEKYLPDVFSGGANTIHDVLYKAQALKPIKAKLFFRKSLMLPNGMRASIAISIRSNGTSSLSSPTPNPDRCNTIALK